jgi:hypothetical protein
MNALPVDHVPSGVPRMWMQPFGIAPASVRYTGLGARGGLITGSRFDWPETFVSTRI